MSRFGFVGGTYQSQAVNADCQRCMNWYPETIESGLGQSQMALYPTPGLAVFAQVAGAAQVRGEWTINGRTFSVIDAQLYEVLSTGALTSITSVGNDGNPVSMVASPQQLLIASAGSLYVYQLQAQSSLGYVAGQVTPIPGATFVGPVLQVGYSDGFFIALVATSETYYVSNEFDATNWTANGDKIISTYPDNTVSMIVDHREIWLLGAKASEVEYDSGNIFPFDTVPGGFVEQGCGAQFATVQLDNSIFWIGARNDQGSGIAWRANGYTPTRVSTFAVERGWQSYPLISDARAFSYQDQGHSFWVINFPSAQATWVYDVATGLWHERGYWNQTTGTYQAALPQCHTFNFGKHLVGDRQSGTIYQMSTPVAAGSTWNFITDAGNPIRRMRRAPHIANEHEKIFHYSLEILMETGISPQPPLLDGAGNPRAAQITLRWSDDGGHSWSNGQDRSIGQSGNFKHRVMFRRLGVSRDRVYELVGADPVPYRIVDAYLKASGETGQSFKPQKRLAKQYAEVA